MSSYPLVDEAFRRAPLAAHRRADAVSTCAAVSHRVARRPKRLAAIQITPVQCSPTTVVLTWNGLSSGRSSSTRRARSSSNPRRSPRRSSTTPPRGLGNRCSIDGCSRSPRRKGCRSSLPCSPSTCGACVMTDRRRRSVRHLRDTRRREPRADPREPVVAAADLAVVPRAKESDAAVDPRRRRSAAGHPPHGPRDPERVQLRPHRSH